jgi:hypothetical protein
LCQITHCQEGWDAPSICEGYAQRNQAASRIEVLHSNRAIRLSFVSAVLAWFAVG